MKRIAFTSTSAVFAAMILTAGCQQEQVRVVSVKDAAARRVGIGFIENRDIRYSPFSSKNFSDMLGFELMQSGYRLRDVDFAPLRQAGAETSRRADEVAAEENAAPVEGRTQNQPEQGANSESTAAGEEQSESAAPENDAADAGEDNRESVADEESYAGDILPTQARGDEQDAQENIDPAKINDGTRDLLPRRLRNIAGELEARERFIDPENRRLSGTEIAKIASANGLDYYIQGAIGRNETGLILETEQNTLVFLEVFDLKGERVGAIELSVNDETLKRSSFLREISAEIIAAFDREIGR